MSLITLQDISVSFGGLPVLDRLNLRIEAGERIGLVGRNGEGKSTLLKLLAGKLTADAGRDIRSPTLKTALLSQEVPNSISGTVYDVVAAGLGKLHELLARHHSITSQLAESGNSRLLEELEEIQHELDTAGGWQAQQQVETILSKLQLDADRQFADLSGGLKRRVMLARALVCRPDLLLLDEPTNHLDIDSITWLEEFLPRAECTLLFITHDRALLKKLATRIIDLDRGQLTSWPGNYDKYLQGKEDFLATEATHNQKFDKKLSQEEAWIRQGIKARRTRNQGRVRALLSLRQERRARRQVVDKSKMEIHKGESSGKLVVQAKNISYQYDNQQVVNNLSTTVLRGDKIGIIGPNGCGKTPLLKLLLGHLQPQQGTIRLGANLQPAYFDQLRAQLDDRKTVGENVADGKEIVTINGHNRHIIGYLKDFLFTPDRVRSPVSVLSGGERNRLLLAKLFTRPANILVLDEPTNDLDVETLELLEELLLEYQGTLLLVSHDRAFLNNVVTSTLVFEGNGRVIEYAGGYDDWLQQRQPQEKSAKPAPRKEKTKPKSKGPRKLTFKEKRELEELPHRIEEMEKEQQELYDTLADPTFYQEKGEQTAEINNRLAELEKALAGAYQYWEELESIAD
jgi:ATP-binding cassette subfamily F protein uup